MRTILLLSASFLCTIATAQSIIYVNQNVQGGVQNGQNWANAFVALTQALNTAQAGDQIWVAKGIYLPTETSDRNNSFVVHSGLHLYGGFAGIESNLSERSAVLHEVVLSGDIGTPNITDDNVYHVLYGINLDSTTVIDGFTIVGGNAMDSDYSEAKTSGGGIFLDVENGSYSAPLIRSCRFVRNRARNGGAIYCKNNANPLILHCTFESNYADNSGGAIYKKGISALEHPFQVDSCTFKKNLARVGFGGGLHLEEPENVYWIKNSVFERDSCKFGLGGAMFIYGNETVNILNINILNCSFIENFSTGGGAIYAIDFGGRDNFHHITIIFCIFEKNKTKNTGGAGISFSTGNQNLHLTMDIKDTEFRENMSYSEGAALYGVCYEDSKCYLNFTNCRFVKNKSIASVFKYATVFYSANYKNSYMEGNFTNCVFAENEGCIGAYATPLCAATTNLSNCTFFQNGNQLIIGKNWEPEFDSLTTFNNLNIVNTVFWEEISTNRLFYNNYPLSPTSKASASKTPRSLLPLATISPMAQRLAGKAIFSKPTPCSKTP